MFEQPLMRSRRARSSSAVAVLSLAAGVLGLSGCSYPAQLVWSPDGSRAAYRVGADAYLVEHTGRVVTKLGASTGGFAWSADGGRLYYALARRAEGDEEGDLPPVRSPVRPEWLAGPRPPFEPTDKGDTAEVHVLDGGRPRRLCGLAGQVLHLSLSPDEAWLAVLVAFDPPDPPEDGEAESDEQGADPGRRAGRADRADGAAAEDRGGGGDESSGSREDSATAPLALYVVSLRSGRVYLLGYPAFVGATFTGPGRLAYVERASGPWQDSLRGARLVEVELDAGHRRLRRDRPYGDPGLVAWLRPLPGGDLLLLAIPWEAAKAAEARGEGPMPPATLYRFARATRELSVVADGLGLMLAVSPDGRRLLALRVNPPSSAPSSSAADGASDDTDTDRADDDDGHADAETYELVLMNADGSRVRSVRRVEAWVPLWPSWRDADHFLLASAEPLGPANATGVKHYAVEEYRVEPGGGGTRVRRLSAAWDSDLLPFVQEPFRRVRKEPDTQPSR